MAAPKRIEDEYLRRYAAGERDLRQADLVDANLVGVNLSGADLRVADLRRANLRGANLSRANLSEADLGRADLSEADLSRASFRGANLSRATLSKADLGRANLSEADLRWADLSEADLGQTNFRGAGLGGANLTRAVARQTLFSELDLGSAKGLDQMHHGGPSSVGIDTLCRSGGRLPEEFLRGCGLQPWEILWSRIYDPALTPNTLAQLQKGIHDARWPPSLARRRVVISYARADEAFVDRLRARLMDESVYCRADRHDSMIGTMGPEIAGAMNLTLVLVLSKASMGSEWLVHTVRQLRDLEAEAGENLLCPVSLDDEWKLCSWPERVRDQILERGALPFAGWEDQEILEAQFEKLLEALALPYPRGEDRSLEQAPDG